ncbi:MAG: aldo/keto reductase [Planctomycetota bacterium]|nr:aldo/keto reductase [Planctomycetota bacterium]
MRYRSLSRRCPDIKVSEIGFGCWTMGGPNWSLSNGSPIGWANVDQAEVTAGVKAGLDAGVNHWDNADIYGNGRAERSLAASFRALGVRRSDQIIATKVGHFWGTAPYAYEPAFIRFQCEQSLRNLQTEYLDIYYFHHGTYVGPGYDGQPRDYLHEAAGVMHQLVKEGKVRAVGQSAYSFDDFERSAPVLKPDVLQNKANMRYDEFIRAGSRLQAVMDREGCTFVAFGPLDQGILLDKFDPEKPPKFEEGDYRNQRRDFSPETLRDVRARLGRLRERFGVKGSPEEVVAALASIACRFVLAHPNVCSTIPGFRNERQARCNVRAAADAPMTPADVEFCRSVFA